MRRSCLIFWILSIFKSQRLLLTSQSKRLWRKGVGFVRLCCPFEKVGRRLLWPGRSCAASALAGWGGLSGGGHSALLELLPVREGPGLQRGERAQARECVPRGCPSALSRPVCICLAGLSAGRRTGSSPFGSRSGRTPGLQAGPGGGATGSQLTAHLAHWRSPPSASPSLPLQK